MLKKFSKILIVLCILLSANMVRGNDDIETLRRIKMELWPKAYRTQDTELLGSILHKSFQMIDADGSRSNRSKELAYIRENKWDPGKFEFIIERLEIYDQKYAIVDGTGKTEKYSYKSSNVFIKTDQGWQAIASHVSGVKKSKEQSK